MLNFLGCLLQTQNLSPCLNGVSYLDLYNNHLYDLLADAPLALYNVLVEGE